MGRKKLSDTRPLDAGHFSPSFNLHVFPLGHLQSPSASGTRELAHSGHDAPAAVTILCTFSSFLASISTCHALNLWTLTFPKQSLDPNTRIPFPTLFATHCARFIPLVFFELLSVIDKQESKNIEPYWCILVLSFLRNNALGVVEDFETHTSDSYRRRIHPQSNLLPNEAVNHCHAHQ